MYVSVCTCLACCCNVGVISTVYIAKNLMLIAKPLLLYQEYTDVATKLLNYRCRVNGNIGWW